MRVLNVLFWSVSWLVGFVSDWVHMHAPEPLSTWGDRVCMSGLTDRADYLQPSQSWLDYALDFQDAEEKSSVGESYSEGDVLVPRLQEMLADPDVHPQVRSAAQSLLQVAGRER